MKKLSKTIKELVPKVDDALYKVLLKKAQGYKIKETTEEYTLVEDELKLNKKRVNVKYYPPDLNAIEIVLNIKNKDIELSSLSDKELEQEKEKLLKKLKLLKESKKEIMPNNNNTA